MKILVKLLVCLTLFSVVSLKSQKETNHWFFGPGLDFNVNPPIPDNNGRGPSGEGCSSISDANGNLLFYSLDRTDPDTVYNKFHQPMANGIGIINDGSSTQSSIIIKKPGSTNIYYLFVENAFGGNLASARGLHYSEIDMSLAAGAGSVTAKNIPLYTNATWGQDEKLCAVKHCNGIDYWVMTHDVDVLNRFRCFLVTSAGVNPTPVLSICGSNPTNWQGQMKFSANGRKIAKVNHGSGPEIFDFDPATGIVSNPITFTTAVGHGCEFSPDGTKFYVSTVIGAFVAVYQLDLCAGSPLAVTNSSVIVGIAPAVSTNFGDLQNASNGKMYVATGVSNTICVINNPNDIGASCNFQLFNQPVGTKMCQWALPNFVSSYFKQAPAPFNFTPSNCLSASFSSQANTGCSAYATVYTSLNWDFGDPNSGAANSSTLASLSHTFSSAGIYTVKLLLNTACGTDTVKQVVNIQANALSISGSTVICLGEKTNLVASGASTYSWNTGATGSSLSAQPAATSTYVVNGVISPGCTISNSMVVIVNECTGLDKIVTDLNFKIYPNPVTSDLSIESEQEAELFIYDALGKQIVHSNQPAGKQNIEFASYANGVYIIKLINKNGSKNLKLFKTE